MKIGADLVQISRLENLSNPQAFIERLLCPEEREYYIQKGRKAQTLAGIFAAKEAAVKCLGKGLGRYAFQEIHLIHLPGGKPGLSFAGKARKYLEEAGLDSMDLSVSHEGDYALAVCLGIGGTSSNKEPPIPLNKLSLDLHPLLLKRDKRGHKGTFGKVALLGGSVGMAGSICLSSNAALRAGSGLVYALVPGKLGPVCQIKLTEVIVRPVGGPEEGCFSLSSGKEALDLIRETDALGIGPGMGRDPSLIDFLSKIFEVYEKPIVLDADAINVLSEKPEILKKGKAFKVLTPHEMEMSRICGLSLKEIQRNREKAALDFSKKYGVGVILKGFGTVACEGKRLRVNSSGNPGMATAGSGDVLTGILTSLFGRGYDPWTAMQLGPYLHGLAGDLASLEKGEESMIAGDILEKIPEAYRLMENF